MLKSLAAPKSLIAQEDKSLYGTTAQKNYMEAMTTIQVHGSVCCPVLPGVQLLDTSSTGVFPALAAVKVVFVVLRGGGRGQPWGHETPPSSITPVLCSQPHEPARHLSCP